MFVSKVVLKAISPFFLFVFLFVILFLCVCCLNWCYDYSFQMLSFMHAHSTFFHQGHDLFKEFEPEMKNVATLVCILNISFFRVIFFLVNPTIKLCTIFMGMQFSWNPSNCQNLIPLSYDFKVLNFYGHSKPVLFINYTLLIALHSVD